MIDTTTNPSLTARSFLFDHAEAKAAGTVWQSLRDHSPARSALRAYRHLSVSATRTIDKEFGAVADDLLEMDLGEVLVSAWRMHAALTESARRTLAAPGSEEVNVLASHRVTSTYRPRVDLILDDVLVKSFEFELEVCFELIALEAVVRSGNLVAFQSGKCTVDAALSLEGLELARRRQSVDLALIVRLHDPIPLIHPIRGSVPVQRASTDGEHGAKQPLPRTET